MSVILNDSNSTVLSANENFICREHSAKVLEHLNAQWENRQFCDVTLIAAMDGKRILAHRNLLAAASQYFSAMFNSPMRESNEKEISLEEMPGNILEILVKYSYTGCIELREDNVETLLQAACLLQLDEVVEACASFLTRQLHPTNCIGITFFAERMSCQKLLQISEAYIVDHFMEVIKTEEFFQLSAEHLARLIASDELNVAWEEEVFEVLMSWIRHDSTQREKFIPELLKLVRLPFLSAEYIAENIASVCEEHGCLKLVLEAFFCHHLPERRMHLPAGFCKPRISTLILDVDLVDGHACIESYSAQTNHWTMWKDNIFSERIGFSWTNMNDKIFILGGEDNDGAVNTVTCVDIKTKEVSTIKSMDSYRSLMCVAVCDNCLYAIGGLDFYCMVLSSVERWDPSICDWSYISNMAIERFAAQAASVKGVLYVLGGEDDHDILSSVECYNPRTNQWTLKAPMLKKRAYSGIVATHDYIYIMGGIIDRPDYRSATVERYDPERDEWIMICSLNFVYASLSCFQFGDRLITIGCSDNNGKRTKNVEVYLKKTNKWSQIAPLLG